MQFTAISQQDYVAEEVEYYLGQFAYYEYLDWDSAKIYLDSAVHIGEQADDLLIHGKLDLYTGWYYQDIAQFDTSRSFFYKALDHFIAANSYNKIADTYGNIGNSYLDVGDMKNALDYQLKSLQMNEQIILLSKEEEAIEAAIRGRAYAWSNISNIYNLLGQDEKTLEYERKSMQYEKSEGDPIGLGISYINMASAFDDLGMQDSGYYYATLAHEIFKENDFSNGLISTNIYLYNYTLQKGNPQLKFLLEAHDLSIEFEDHYSQVLVLGYLVSEEFGFSRDSIESMVKRGKYLIEKYDFEDSQYGFYLAIAKSSARYRDYKKAYKNLMHYVEYFTERELANEGVDFESAELRHEFQLQAMQDSIEFVKTIDEHKLEAEQQKGRQRLILTVSFGGGLIMLVFLIFLFRALKVRKQTNAQLSEKNALIERQKDLVEEKNKEIFDSISYAKRLQFAILSPLDILKENFKDAFVFYQPKDVVSGDFYWFEQHGNLLFIAAADCTGHGVPGAMVSVVCSNALHRTVNEFNLKDPGEILNKCRDLVIDTFDKTGESVKDGMDISLCVFDVESKKVKYAGANNPLWIIRNQDFLTLDQKENRSTFFGEKYALIEFKPNKQPIGWYNHMVPFETKEIELLEGDQLYLFTDGYADQFGGTKGKKLKYKNLKQILLNHADKDCKEQMKELKAFLINWIGDLEQIDDICIIGIKP